MICKSYRDHLDLECPIQFYQIHENFPSEMIFYKISLAFFFQYKQNVEQEYKKQGASLAPQTPQETIKLPAQSRRENTAKSQRHPGQPMLVSMQQPCTKKKLLEGNNTYMKSRFST